MDGPHRYSIFHPHIKLNLFQFIRRIITMPTKKKLVSLVFFNNASIKKSFMTPSSQVLILSHPSIGGFLTHCGWNSTLEGVCAGRPMITWPMFADQFYNEKMVVQVLRIGESVGAKFAIPLGNEEKFGVVVKRREVKEAIDKVMDEGKEGEERRERAKKYADVANKAIEEGGSSYINVKLLIEEIRQI